MSATSLSESLLQFYQQNGFAHALGLLTPSGAAAYRAERQALAAHASG